MIIFKIIILCMIFIIIFFAGVYVGYLMQVSKSSDFNYLDIELFPANTNREIAYLSDNNGTSEKIQLLTKLAKKVNEASEVGLTKLSLDYFDELNREIDKKLSKTDILRYFENAGYSIKFVYDAIPCSRIEFITWEEM